LFKGSGFNLAIWKCDVKRVSQALEKGREYRVGAITGFGFLK
jgi:hypothetical protein